MMRIALAEAAAGTLFLLLAFGTLTIWMPARWPLSVVESGAALLAALLAIRAALAGRRLETGFVLVPAGVAAAFGLVSLASGLTVCRHDTTSATLYWAAALAILFAGLQLFSDPALRGRFLIAFWWFAVALAAWAVLSRHTAEGKFLWLAPTPYPELLGPFQNRNNLAALLELALPLGLWRAIRSRRNRWRCAALSALLAGAIVAAGSRAGTVIALLEITTVFLIARSRKLLPGRQLAIVAGATTGLLAITVAVAGWELLWLRLSTGDLLLYRREILQSTLAMIADRPWTGFGLGAYQTVYPSYALFDVGQVVNHAHNDWLEWAAEGGVPFALVLFSLCVWAARPAVRSVWGLGILAVFAHALVDYPMQRLGVAAWVFALLAALAARELNRPATPANGRRSSANPRAKPA